MNNNMFKVRDFYCKYIDQDNPNFAISEKYKNEMIQIDVFIKKEDELKKVNTIITSNKENEKEIKEFVEKVMCQEIGKILEDGTVSKDYFRQGWIYKNYENFYKREGTCYISEYDEGKFGDTGISYDGIKEEVVHYLVQCGVNVDKVPETLIETMVENVFETVDWQYTCSLIEGDQWLEEYVNDLPKEYFFEKEEEDEL